MSDEEISQEIKERLEALNNLIYSAAKRGLRIDIRDEELGEFGIGYYPHFNLKIYKSIL